jgi:hypothetical protein
LGDVHAADEGQAVAEAVKQFKIGNPKKVLVIRR